MKAYSSRAKVGIQAYRLWLANSPDWKPQERWYDKGEPERIT
jgi:hypothetical protein